ncbi:MAG: hypothetical protein KF810_16850 [Rhizobiaceae bacterium]|nr:hypothetical protein [Rhizobiaceae bacterium]
MEILFPLSTAPSQNPSENGGRLINAYAETAPQGARSKAIYRRAPGLDAAFTVGSATYRGSLLVGSILYVANGDKVYSVTKSGSSYNVDVLTGDLSGEGLVTMAHNMRATKQIIIQTTSGPYDIQATTVAAFVDSDLPSSTMVAYQDGYFFWCATNGRVTASDLNDDEVNANSFVTAESAPDGLVRVVPYRRDTLFMGDYSTEVWTNAGSTPFPYERQTVLPIGLFGLNAVAGYEPGFPGPLVFVGQNCVVYRMGAVGQMEPVSQSYLERLISQISDRGTLRLFSFISAGHHFVALTTPDWTWVLDTATGQWHERESYGATTWRVGATAYAFDEWLAFDKDSNQVYRVNDRNPREATHPLIAEIVSAQHPSFPARSVITRAAFDFVTGVGMDRGIDPIESGPRVSISWSDDGGRTWGNPLLRNLGTQGEYRTIDIRNCGRTKREGRQWKIRCSDPVEFSLLGGSMFGDSRL